jgi:dihydroorotase
MGQQAIIRVLKGLDTHVHGRQGDLLRAVAPMTARQFWGAIFEPNLQPPITTPEQGRAYVREIKEACSGFPGFRPYVLAYLTDALEPSVLAEGLADDTFIGAKFYPKGATTNSDSGIVDVSALWTPGTRQHDVIRTLAEHHKVIQLHCELNFDLHGRELDPYDKEPYFFKEILPRLLEAHPDARWSCEHLTCTEGADFMRMHGGRNLGCSVTPHHLLYDRRDMFRGGLRPHLFCLPVIKASEHRTALLDLATSGLPFVYAGTDSAPHDRRKKECDCCSGGVFTAHAAVELYAEAFEEHCGVIDGCFDAFMGRNGPAFYDLSANDELIELRKEAWSVNEPIAYSSDPEDTVNPHGYKTHVTRDNKDPAFSWKMID